MTTHRTKSISTKVTEAEYQLVGKRAAPLTVSEWARTVLLGAAHADPLAFAALAETIALRIVLLNWHAALAERGAVTFEELRALVERADSEKWTRAEDSLAKLRASIDAAGR